jgi:hypothetical protein
MRQYYANDFNRLVQQSMMQQCQELQKMTDEAAVKGVPIHIFMDAATVPMSLIMMLDDECESDSPETKPKNPFTLVEDVKDDL